MSVLGPEAHRRALSKGRDVPEERPLHPIPVNLVGITGRTVWIRLPQGRLPFEAEIGTSLSGDRRGIHISRLLKAAAGLESIEFEGPLEYARALALEAKRTQGASTAEVAVKGKVPVLRRADVSGEEVLETVRVEAGVKLTQEGEGEEALSVTAAHLTACPCTQAYLQAAGASGKESGLPPPTHTQRCLTTLRLFSPRLETSWEALHQALESALHLVQGLLKRPDEAELVLEASMKPQFVEDVVREVGAAVLCGPLSGLDPRTVVEVEALSTESIHDQDVTARLRTDLRELGRRLGERT